MFYLLFLLHVVCGHINANTPIVQTEFGFIRGQTIKNPASESGAIYHAFQGIPYATPPIGQRRFKPAVPPENWPNVRNATEAGPACANTMSNVSSEDCLYLNIFTPELPKQSTHLKPVIVYIHGGAFIFGDASFNQTRPDFLVLDDVVIVTFHYRLNVFGFLNTLDENASGNAGLKDQVAALRWIRANIHYFGGDPSRVTIFGQSAGAASVQYLMMSPLAEGLFHAAIADSGSALNRWAFQKRPLEQAFELGELLGIKTNSSKYLVEKLRKIDSLTLLQTADSMKYNYLPIDAHPFAPSLEAPLSGAFMTTRSYDALKLGHYQKSIPYLTGYNEHEGNYATWYISLGKMNYSQFENDPELLVPPALNLEKGSEASKNVTSEIMTQYFRNDLNDPKDFEKFMSDELFVRGIRKSVEFMKIYSDVYLYKFTYVGGGKFEEPVFFPVTGHGAELLYLFNVHMIETAEDTLTRMRLSKLWTNFAKFACPTPAQDPLLNNINWAKADSGDNTTFLLISNDLIVAADLDEQNYTFWERLFTKYGELPFYIW